VAAKFSYRAEQRFECRDCPGRCCSLPWSAPIGEAEAKRLLDEPWIEERVGAQGLAVIEQGVLPLCEVGRRLRCAFLEDDHRCSMQNEFGHDYLPRTCQVYPFGFVQNEKKEVVVHLSRLCPSVRDDLGKPLKGQLRAKLKQQGAAETLAEKMGTLQGTVLSRP
jgi:lysine-N-methylase